MKGNRIIILLLLTLLTSIVAWAQPGLNIEGGVTNATVKFYVSDSKPTAAPTGGEATQVNAGQWLIVEVKPNEGYWTYDEMLTVQTAGSIGGAEAPVRRAIQVPASPTALDGNQADGKGYYYYQVPEGCTYENGYRSVIVGGDMLKKVDLSKASKSEDGKTFTATTDSWTATITLDEVSFIYNGSAQGPTISSFNLTNGTKTFNNTADHVSISGSGTDAGNYDATLSAVATGCLKNSFSSVAFSVGQKTLTIIADTKSKIYGDPDPELTYTYDGLVGTDKINCELSREAGENVGTYAITHGTVTASDNYSITYRGANLTIKEALVVVTITGHKNSAPYDGKNHSVNGYDVGISNPLYNVTDFTFNGTAEANRTDTGTTNMGLKSDMFVNNNQNFEVTFIIATDGYQEISPINVVVTITGHHDVSTYDNKEHTVSGYDVESSTPVYKEEYFTFNSSAEAKRTEVGTTYMGLTADQFANTSKNFKTVTFNVTDGYQTITSVNDVVVTITGHNNATDYDGKNHSVSGYDVEISNPLYKESDFTFSGKAEANRTNAGKTMMDLQADMFVNNNKNFNVTFNVTDGYQEIISINVVVTITGHHDVSTYDGTEHVVEGYNVAFSNPVCTAADIAFSGTDVASQIDVGTTNMGLAAEQFANVNNNFDSMLFRVTDGYQTIRPKKAVINVTVKPKTYDGTTNAEVSGTIDGLVPGERMTVVVTGTFDNAEPGTDKTVNLGYELKWDSAKETNYEVDKPSTVKGIIIDLRNSGIEVRRNDTNELVDNGAYLTEMPDGTMRVDHIRIINPDAVNGIACGVSVYIPATLKNHEGKTGAIYGVGSDIIVTDANVPVTDIYMPDTEEIIDVAKQAFRLVADESVTARIHTTLPLLDDYALTAGLKAEYEDGHVMSTITTTTQFWTFSCGVDVLVPEKAAAYICQRDGNDAVAGTKITVPVTKVDAQTERVIIKANNGVMMGCDDKNGGTFDLVAWPSAERPSGTAPTTDDAKSYPGNLLVLSLVATHFNPNDYYILYNNAFHELASEDVTSVGPCKAVLRKNDSAMAKILDIFIEENANSIHNAQFIMHNNEWYDLQGRKLEGKPTVKGIYIYNGRKVTIQ